MLSFIRIFNKVPALGFIIWLIAALFFLYEFFLRAFMGTIAKQLIPDLHLTAETFSIISSAYYLAYAGMQLPVGFLTDKFGVKRILLFATLLCALSAIMFAHSPNFIFAFFSRVIMGLGSSFAFICLLVIATTWFPASTFGLFSGASQFIGIMGPLLAGGPLIKILENAHGNWRYVLSEISAAGIILTLLVFLIVKEKPRKQEKIIVLKKPESFMKNTKRLFNTPQAWYICLYSAMVYLAMVLLGEVWGVIYLETKGLSQADAANIISTSWLGYALGCLALGALSDAIKRRKSILVFCSFLGIFATCCILYSPLSFTFAYILFFALGIAASGQSVAFATIVENVDLTTKATALGFNNGTITFFGMLFPLIVGFWIGASAHKHSGSFQLHDFTPAFSIIPLVYLSAFLIAVFLIKETFCKPQKQFCILSRSNA